MSIVKGLSIDEFGGSCNPYYEPCPDCDVGEVPMAECCSSCKDTRKKPVLVAEHDRWWVRALKWMMERK